MDDKTVSKETGRAAVAVIPEFLEGFITEVAYAAGRGVSVRTCQRDRQLRNSPPYVVIGRSIYYRIDAVRDWLLARERNNSSHLNSSRSESSIRRRRKGGSQ